MTRLLIGMTGTFGVLSMPSYLVAIRNHFSEIKIIMTQSATQFIPANTFSAFADGIYTKEFPLCKDNLSHIELARWAELFVVLPATAHVIAQAAHGLADSLLTTTILAFQKNVIFFPNMNSTLWDNSVVQKNVSLLRENHIVIDPIQKAAFEYASRSMEVNHVLPSIDSVTSILLLKAGLK